MLRRWNKISGWRDLGRSGVALCAWRVEGEDRKIDPSLVLQDFSRRAFPRLVFTNTGWSEAKEALSRLENLQEQESLTALQLSWILGDRPGPVSSLEELGTLIRLGRLRALERWGAPDKGAGRKEYARNVAGDNLPEAHREVFGCLMAASNIKEVGAIMHRVRSSEIELHGDEVCSIEEAERVTPSQEEVHNLLPEDWQGVWRTTPDAKATSFSGVKEDVRWLTEHYCRKAGWSVRHGGETPSAEQIAGKVHELLS